MFKKIALLLLCVGIFIRAFHFGVSPVGIHQDEAMSAVDALALSEYGTDHYGMRFPVHFTAWVGSQQSVLLAYCMAPFIRLLGFNTVAVRLPMLIVSCFGLLALYFLGRELGDAKTGLLLEFLGVICPWHYMQSRWSFDCNMFPHMFLFGVCFLLAGMRKRRLLYLSMVFFALCCYSYGVADYSVPLFLLAMAVYLLKKRFVRMREIIWCACVFAVLSLPEYLSMFLTVMKLDSIETPLITIPSFLQSFRGNDILLTNFSWEQLWRNAAAMLKVVWADGDKSVTNTIVRFGPVYYLTVAFFALGLGVMAVRLYKKTAGTRQLPYVLLICWLLMGIWVGLNTREVTINRINVIFYAVLAVSAVGIAWCVGKCRILILPVAGYYGISALLFAASYFGPWTELSRTYYYDPYIQALEYAENLECDVYYITPDPQGEGVNAVGEILTMYCHEIDALYYQGVSNVQGGRERLPYTERYRYTDITEEILRENQGKSVVYLVNGDEMGLFEEEKYDITSFYDGYFVIHE